MDANDSDCLVGVAVAGAALGEATETGINTTNRGIAKTPLPRPPRRHIQHYSLIK